ncbi:MAG: hypothetical protein JOS17DRAFT_846153 [Linnemannia elongata]|nr:MAG: hypothetical protein JOS17DRAFT_846153 [Linnemannia elongata]
MHFKSTIIAALLVSFVLAAEPQAALIAEPESMPAAEAQPMPAAEPQAGPADSKVRAKGIFGSILWPIGFSDQCNALFKISADLDKQLAHAKSKNNRFSCTPAQNAIIAKSATCSPLSIVWTLIWPLAFAQQENLGKRIAAQSDCLTAYEANNC